MLGKRYRCAWRKPGALGVSGLFVAWIFLLKHRYKSPRWSVTGDSNRGRAVLGQDFSVSALFEGAFCGLGAAFFQKNSHKHFGVVLSVLTDRRNGAFFVLKRALGYRVYF